MKATQPSDSCSAGEPPVVSANTRPTPLRLWIVVGSLDVGGSEVHISQIAPRLAAHGYDITVFCIHGGPVTETLTERGVKVLAPSRRRPRTLAGRVSRIVGRAVRLWWGLLRSRPDAVHCFLQLAFLVGAPAALAARVPNLLMGRRSRSHYLEQSPLLASAERRLLRCTCQVTANSGAVAGDLRREGITEDRISLIYSGVDHDRFSATPPAGEVRKQLGIADSSLVLVVVANLIPYKGHGGLLTALTAARSELPESWSLLCIGRDDGVLGDLQTQVAAAELQRHVAFLGSRKDIPHILGAADIGLLPSYQEGFSNALLEYMAAGLPSIVTDVGGNAEAIRDGVDGLVVAANDPEDLSRAIVALARDPEQRARFGASASERARTEFSMDRCVAAYDALYRRIVDVEVA